MPTDIETIKFTAQDRCDMGCSSQALAVAQKGDLKLMMCWHHKTKHFESLLEQDWEIIEDYQTYLSYGAKPSEI